MLPSTTARRPSSSSCRYKRNLKKKKRNKLLKSKNYFRPSSKVVNEKELARLQDRWGNTALHYAVQLRQHQLALYLLELGCRYVPYNFFFYLNLLIILFSSEATNRYGVTPCHMTCEANDAVMLSNLLLNTQHPEAIVTAQAQDGRSLIHLCALHNACEAAEVVRTNERPSCLKAKIIYWASLFNLAHRPRRRMHWATHPRCSLFCTGTAISSRSSSWQTKKPPTNKIWSTEGPLCTGPARSIVPR